MPKDSFQGEILGPRLGDRRRGTYQRKVPTYTTAQHQAWETLDTDHNVAYKSSIELTVDLVLLL